MGTVIYSGVQKLCVAQIPLNLNEFKDFEPNNVASIVSFAYINSVNMLNFSSENFTFNISNPLD